MFLKKDSIGKGLYNMSVVLFLVVLLFCHAPAICLAEDADWLINYHSRMKVVEKIKTRSYHSDEPISKSSSDEYSYENRQLPFRFPVLSPPHNVVFITRNTNQNTYSVFFDVYGSFCTEQTYFVYTNDEKQKTHFEDKIIRNSKNNWRLRDKWYRIKEY